MIKQKKSKLEFTKRKSFLAALADYIGGEGV